jgi:hypothetical protein
MKVEKWSGLETRPTCPGPAAADARAERQDREPVQKRRPPSRRAKGRLPALLRLCEKSLSMAPTANAGACGGRKDGLRSSLK